MAETRRRQAEARRTAEGATLGSTSPPPICQVAFCPFCMAVTALAEVKPEVMEHLLLAGREVLLAVRAVIDARLEGHEPPPKLERLNVT